MNVPGIRGRHRGWRRIHRERDPDHLRDQPVGQRRLEPTPANDLGPVQDVAVLGHEVWRENGDVRALPDRRKQPPRRGAWITRREPRHEHVGIDDDGQRAARSRRTCRVRATARAITSSSSRSPPAASRMSPRTRRAFASRRSASATTSSDEMPSNLHIPPVPSPSPAPRSPVPSSEIVPVGLPLQDPSKHPFG